MHFIHFASVK